VLTGALRCSARAGRGLSWIKEDVRDQREPTGEPPVHLVRDVLGPVGADPVVERYPGGDDEMVRPDVHGAQVEQGIDAGDLSCLPVSRSTNVGCGQICVQDWSICLVACAGRGPGVG
jgi:hypothetical protein